MRPALIDLRLQHNNNNNNYANENDVPTTRALCVHMNAACPVLSCRSSGGAVKASGVTVAHSDTAWKAKIASSSLSKCDCFHPSRSGQSYLADLAFNGLTCSTATPCCDEPAKRVSLTDAGSCSNRAVVTSGESYPAL